ncbi:MAG: hypothetical protein JW869_02790 [Candidatus Omnitrophica bacterium]|nr:hypothetical protein [Candidatus Omnitrophota bacterium]
MANKKINDILVKISLVLASIIIVILILECFMRIFFPHSQYAIVCAPWGFTHKPNCSITYYDELAVFGKKPHPVPIHYNSKGLRDYEYDYEKPEGTFRILFLGDSWVEDMASYLDNLFSKRLEKKLNSFDVPVKFEVINGGHYAFDNAQELMFYLKEGIRYHPDIVFVMYTTDVPSPEYAVVKDGKLKLKYQEFTRSQKLYRNLITLVRSNSHLGNFVLDRLGSIKSLDQLLRQIGWREKKAALAKFPEGHPQLANIEDQELAEQLTVKQVVDDGSKGNFSFIDKLIWKRFKEAAQEDEATFVFIHSIHSIYERDRKFLAEENIPFLSIKINSEQTKKIKEADIKNGTYDETLDSHRFGYKQHPIVAEQILQFLLDKKLIPFADEIADMRKRPNKQEAKSSL